MKKQKHSKSKSSNRKVSLFEGAVINTPDISNAFCKGLQALGSNSNKIDLKFTYNCEGSVDIDTALKSKYHNKSRWDYCLSYKGEVFFVEVHSTNTSNVDEVINKLKWLENWLINEAPLINKMKAKSKPAFYWIQTNGFHILPNSPQFRKVVQAGIKPIARLKL